MYLEKSLARFVKRNLKLYKVREPRKVKIGTKKDMFGQPVSVYEQVIDDVVDNPPISAG